MKKVKVGVIGCGKISGIYLKNIPTFESTELVACADLLMERAQAQATQYNTRACTVDELLADPQIEIVLNLTIPKVHFDVALAAINAGKHVYNEKPLTATCEQAQKLLAAAKAKKLLVGCAPDTFLGAGIQTCRKLIDDGAIGRPLGATAFMTHRGPERWHPDPEFFYDLGGGPMLDMGPYYLTAFACLIGPVRRVTASAQKSWPQRTITSPQKKGQKIDVKIPTHYAGVMDFANGAVGTILTSFDVWKATLPFIEIYGEDGTLEVPNPNTFAGPVKLFRGNVEKKDKEMAWEEIPLTHIYDTNSRGIGVADMACAIRTGRPHRANGQMAYHVLETMTAFEEASNSGRHVELKSTCDRPAALPVGLEAGKLD